MFKIDENMIKDRLCGVSFQFLTEEEIKKLSVVEVRSTNTFDTLDNPIPGGLHDKKMGVSPFDRNSSCPTCGLTSNYCTGHHGHIQLVAPIYNPFLIKELYRIMKAKCFHCHKIRISESKINAFVSALKLIKAGEIIGSSRIKQYFLSIAKETSNPNGIFNYQDNEDDIKKISKIKNFLNKMTGLKNLMEKQLNDQDVKDQLLAMQRKHNIEKERLEHEIMQMLEDIEENTNPEATNKIDKSGMTSIIQKFQLDLTKEIWSSVITTKCPHCKKNSPAFRKDGYTKMFVKPLAGRNKNVQIQKNRLTGASDLESQTVASTNLHSSRKQSGVNENEEDLESIEEAAEENETNEDEQNTQFEDEMEEEYQEGGIQKYISPIEVKEHIQKMWRKEGDLLNLMYGKFEPLKENGRFETQSLGHQIFFLNQIVVPPTRFRPESEGSLGGGGGSGKAYLHTHSAMLLKILQANEALKDALLDQNRNKAACDANQNQAGKAGKLGITTQKWIQLQEAINCFMDSSMASKNSDKEQGGIRQLLEKKEGMFRMKMMGKRVNYGGRSVISPDPYITTDQIGVPIFMARKLTFPESVSSFNAERLRQAVRNGTQKHPGANIVEDEETGQQIHLDHMSAEQRDGLARLLNVGRKIVYRHLSNNDPLLVNRQPTLHKPSIMAHRCRVLPKEQTIRMHYANCNTYNADFDGDEMNLHLPQSYQALSEAYSLMATHKQYCVPTSGKPLRGLIQDSVVSGVFMTSKDTFLSKEQYNQLVYIGLRELIEMDKIGKIVTLQPAIIKPQQKWTGKQVISTLLKNIVDKEQEYKAKQLTGLNLSFKAKLAAKEWGPIGKEEGDVLFRDNEHLRGTLDKNAFGASEYGLVHAFYEVYGSEKAGELLTSLARVFSVYLQTHGFTCGLDDLMINQQYNKLRRETIENGHKEGIKAAAEFSGIKNYEPEEMNFSNRVVRQSKKNFDKDYDKFTKMALPENPYINKKCIQKDNIVRKALEKKMSAAGSDFAMLEIELDNILQGKMNDATSKVLKEIIPDGLIKKFPQNNLSAMVMTGAKGGVVNQTQISVLLGQQSLEGRRVPKMQNGKTLPCYLSYDPNPRSSGYISDRFISGLRPQDFYFHCMAGREGLIDTAVKTSRSGYLQRCLIKQLESLIVNYDMTVRDNDGSVIQFIYGDDGIDVINNSYLDKFEFLEQNFNSLISSGQDIIRKVDSNSVPLYKKQQRRVAKQIKKDNPHYSNTKAILESADPVMSVFHPQKYFGAISEKQSSGIDNYVKNDCQYVRFENNKKHLLKRKYQPIEPDTFRQMYYLKFMKSLVHAGENVGTIAAQSVGEPSTQMTLNTFHLAGHGAGNMTLGVPRLKEILMTTPYNIKTPIMKIFFKDDIKLDLEKCQKFANMFQKLKLADVVKSIQANQSLTKNQAGGLCRVYQVQLQFDSAEDLKRNLNIDQKKLTQMFSDYFIPQLMNEIFKQLKKAEGTTNFKMNQTGLSSSNKQKNKSGEGAGDDSDMIEDEDKAIKDANKQQTKKVGDEGERPNKQGMDDEDILSEQEQEMQNEINCDIDGNIQISKDVRGYEEDDNQNELDDDQVEQEVGGDFDSSSIASQQQNRNKTNKDIKDTSNHKISGKKKSDSNDLDNYTKQLSEAHSKYIQYLGPIKFDTKQSIASVDIIFPIDFKKVLMLTLAEQTINKVLIRSVPNIEKCSLIKAKKENEEPYLIVQGINFDAFYAYQHIIDVNRIETNHSYALKNKYGIEAMRANIMKEVMMVFGAYGISVDKRHLSLICDFMTFNGDYRAFNRIGMEESSSPFLKMSYETTMKYLISASSANEKDDMSTPSSAIVMGQIPRVGTGMIDLLHDGII